MLLPGHSSWFVFISALALLGSFGFFPAKSAAKVRLPKILGDSMVIQRDVPIRIWGWAGPGEQVTVSLGTQKSATQTGQDGRWSVTLPARKAGGPYELTVAGENTLTLSDLWIGEVWFCSGQSNMALGVVKSLNHAQEIREADYPRIRWVHCPQRASDTPADDADVNWTICSPRTVSYFSATAYYFGREIHQQLDVPVGLVVSAVNGTRIEPWTPPQGIKAVAELAPETNNHAGELYHGMVHPFTPFAIRGVIWYQGEGNVGDGITYYHRMRALVGGWRQAWGIKDLPFYYVQIAPLNWGGKPRDEHPKLWEAQTRALKIPHTGMVVTNDIGNPGNAHPRNKQEVGRRLSLWALAKTYGKNDLPHCGPIYRKMTVQGRTIRVEFDNTYGGLASRDGKPLSWFTIAGEDRRFVPADAQIEGSAVVVSSEKVEKPVAVRFAWDQAAEPNLMNKAGFPVSAFRTDGVRQDQ